MLTKIDIQLVRTMIREEFEILFEEKFTILRNEILNFKDAILTEIRDMRLELVVLNGRSSMHSDQLENHEVRITKIEKRKQTKLN
jgi:hypothetical protein